MAPPSLINYEGDPLARYSLDLPKKNGDGNTVNPRRHYVQDGATGHRP